MNIKPISSQDILLWPDGTWCYRENAHEYHWMSDDVEVIPEGTPRWAEFSNQPEKQA